MCGSMADIQCPTAEIRRGNKKRRRKKNKPQHENIYGLPITQGDRKIDTIIVVQKFENIRRLYVENIQEDNENEEIGKID